MEIGIWLPMLWAQTPPADPSAPAPVVVSPTILVPLMALRRWYGSLTLSSPDPLPNRFGLWAWLLGLAALLIVCIIAQGPRRALGQLLDLPGHGRLLSAALARLKRSGRLMATLLGATVVSWTGSQALSYHKAERTDELMVLKASKSIRELAVEQGVLASLTPLRDVCGLADNMSLLIAAAIIVFKLSADRWGSGAENPLAIRRAPLPPWTIVCWGGAWLYAMYRLANLVVDPDGLPLGGCLFVEAGIVPGLMALADGLLFAWVLVELRRASPGVDAAEGLDAAGIIPTVPAAILGCLAALPARYVATGTWLFLDHFSKLAGRWLTTFVSGWGLVGLQGAALVFAGVVGAAAWPAGSIFGVLRHYGRMLRLEGGRVIATLAIGGLACGAVSGLAYFLVLALPAQPWVLSAADGYAHYASLPIGLVTLAALVELGGRSLAPSAGKPAAEA